jgi:hypothetical protein
MPSDFPDLPRDEAALSKVINKHMAREDIIMLYKRTMWLVAFYYLNGARSFSHYDPSTQSVRPLWVDDNGNAEFMSQELLAEINRVAGRILSFDLRPKVLAQGQSLGAVRSRAVGQVIMDSIVSDDQLELVKEQFAFNYACLGSCGLIGHLEDHPTVGLVGDLEVVHPRELCPFPSLGPNSLKQRGIIRQRFVPLRYLEEKFGKKKMAKSLDDIEWYQKQLGDDQEIDSTGYGSTISINFGQGTDGMAKGDPHNEDMHALVKIRELWTWGARNMVQRYVVQSGMCVLDDIDFRNEEVYCPLGYSTFLDTGGFYGAGMFDLLFSMSRNNELLLKTLFNNVRDMDRYGVLVIPQGDLNEKPMLRDVGRGLKMLPWAPDPIAEGFRPFAIQPATTSDFPGKVATMAQAMMRNLSPIGDLAAEKGRVDSAQGLSFLDERLNQAMTRPSHGIRVCFSTAYRGLATQAVKGLAHSPRALPVSRLSLDLAGAVVDPIEGTVSFPKNPLPDLSRLSFNVQEVNPKSISARKGEALDLLEKQVTDPASFILFSVMEGVDWAMWMEEDKAAYESIVRNILIVYGDGEQPGEATISPYSTKPDLQLRVLSAFMARPSFTLASVEVQDALAHYRDTLLEFSGRTLPAAVPNPDDSAILLRQLQQGAGAGATPQPSFPPG